MQPLGYYGLEIKPEIEKAIDSLELHELLDLADDMTGDMVTNHYIDNEEVSPILDGDKPIFPHQLSDLQKLGLIRGLCDRIELKFMEQAK